MIDRKTLSLSRCVRVKCAPFVLTNAFENAFIVGRNLQTAVSVYHFICLYSFRTDVPFEDQHNDHRSAQLGSDHISTDHVEQIIMQMGEIVFRK